MVVKFEANSIAQPKATWMSVSEAFVRRHLQTETPDPETLDVILSDMVTHGSEADDGIFVFRAVKTIDEADYRIAYTTAFDSYLGFGSVVLDSEAGISSGGYKIRKIGIKPENWEWQTNRFASGLHTAVEPHELDQFRDIWTMKN